MSLSCIGIFISLTPQTFVNMFVYMSINYQNYLFCCNTYCKLWKFAYLKDWRATAVVYPNLQNAFSENDRPWNALNYNLINFTLLLWFLKLILGWLFWLLYILQIKCRGLDNPSKSWTFSLGTKWPEGHLFVWEKIIGFNLMQFLNLN